MTSTLKTFVAEREDRPGAGWLARFRAGYDEAKRWYLGQGRAPPPKAETCRAALLRHMPELIGLYDHACSLLGDDDLSHCILSHYRPAPSAYGCTQAVWLGRNGPALVRNYDFALDTVSGRFESTSWLGRETIASAQRPWGGCLDGMNADGLVASITFGGGTALGRGFSVILVLRYVLETCRTVSEAVAALNRIPIAQSQNVTLLESSGVHATVFLGPDRAPGLSRALVCANHQDEASAAGSPAIADSLGRQQRAARALADPTMTLDGLIELFLASPIHSRRLAAPTVYTAVYWPGERRVAYVWPGKAWSQRLGHFQPGRHTHDYGVLDRHPPPSRAPC